MRHRDFVCIIIVAQERLASFPTPYQDKIFDNKEYMTFDLGSRLNVTAQYESLYMISYMYTIQIKSPSPLVSEIFDN